MGGYYDYYYDYPAADAAASAGAAGIVAGFLGVYLLVCLLAFGLSIAMYILQSLGMYTIADRRGIKNPWMAWLPVTNMWILGSIADQYQYVTKGQVRSRRKVLLGLDIALVALILVLVILFVGMFVNLIFSVPEIDYMSDSEILELILTPYLSMMGVLLAIYVVAIILAVFQYICYYNLFASCDPEHKTLFTVLGILFNVTLPFFVFACRKKDLGMPPRKDAQPQPVLPPVEEPWNNE